jgi:DNA polymerase III subunit delta
MNKPLTSTQFLSQLPGLKPQPAYLIIGDDGYLVDKVYRAAKELARKSLQEFETLTLYGDELTISEIGEYLDSYSIFSDNRLLVIKNAHQLRDKELIAKYLQDPEASQVLILIADSVDGRQAVWKQIKETCLTVEVEKVRFPGEMANWLNAKLKSHRKTIEDQARNLFLEKVELDFCTAENEMEKLLIYIGERGTITVNDVHTTLPTTRVGTMADFYRVLGNRQTKDVILKVNDMLENDWADLQILSVLSRFFLTLWKITALKAKHISDREILSSHLNDLFQSQRENYLAYAKKYGAEAMPGIFETLLETDSQIKLTMAESNVLMTMCVSRICNEQ